MLPRTLSPKTALAAAVLATLATLVAAGPLAAQQEPAAGPLAAGQDEAAEPLDQYRVELIVFAYGDALAGTTEDWSAPTEDEPEDGPPDDDADADADGETGDGATPEPASDRSAENARQDRPAGAPASAQDADTAAGTADGEPEEPVFRFMPLPEEALQLKDLYRRLAGTNGYEPLLHVAWQQPGYEPADARPLDLSRLAELPERLRGEARLYRSRFLHLELQLELLSAPRGDLPARGTQQPLPQAGGMAEGEPLAALAPDVYRLSERRKLRSGELHYYDHPRYGVVAKVTPVESETTPDEPGGGDSGDASAASADTGSPTP
jgi:hypothetical protein